MSSYSSLLAQLEKSGAALRKLVGFGKGVLKDKISKSLAHVTEAADKPELLDFSVVLEPYITTAGLDPKHYHAAVLDGFLVIFTHASYDVSPNEAQTSKMIEIVRMIYRSDFPDSSQLKFCKVISAAFSSAPGRMYVHGALLKECFSFLLRMNSETQSENIAEVTQMTIQESLRQFINRFNTKDLVNPNMSKVSDLARFVSEFVVKTAVSVQELMPGSIKATSLDVDLVLVMTIHPSFLHAKLEITHRFSDYSIKV